MHAQTPPVYPRQPPCARSAAAVLGLIWACALPHSTWAGEVRGTAFQHTPSSQLALVAEANAALPATSGSPGFFGKWHDIPATSRPPVPVVLFLHGSSGLGLKAIEDWQRWLAELGIASAAPDSFALPDRLTYDSPVDKEVYERIHALRASEIELASAALRSATWADPTRLVLAGTSEGAVAVARHSGAGFVGRMLFSWSCEDNYFVDGHRTAIPPDQPALNVISASDPFFSLHNKALGNPHALGHCGEALRDNKNATIVLIPGASHTLLNLPAARHAASGFLGDVFMVH